MVLPAGQAEALKSLTQLSNLRVLELVLDADRVADYSPSELALEVQPCCAQAPQFWEGERGILSRFCSKQEPVCSPKGMAELLCW